MERHPEQPVPAVQERPRPYSFEDTDLLSKRQHLKRGIGTTPKENPDGSKECEEECEHESFVLTPRNIIHTFICCQVVSC